MENNKDVFISYEHGDKEKVDAIVSLLEKQGVSCWIAPRDVGPRRYAKAIVEGIENCKIFLLMLSHTSAVSEHVLNEVEMAYNKRRAKNGSLTIETICLEKLNLDDPEFNEIMYYIRRINFIQDEKEIGIKFLADEFINANKGILKIQKTRSKSQEKDSEYQSTEGERNRLLKQNTLLEKFDSYLYQREISCRKNVKILDVGCGDGTLIINRVKNVSSDYEIVGIDNNAEALKSGKSKYAGYDIHFENVNITDSNLLNVLLEITQKYHIEQYDIINISMLLLHIKGKTQLMRVLRRFLKLNGVIIIKDIDDDINFAYPDEDDLFYNAYSLATLDVTAGIRDTGRRIYNVLTNAGFKDITLEKTYLTTIGMNYDEKECFFEFYFKMIYDDLKYCLSLYPDNFELSDAVKWYDESFDELYERFLKDDFVFGLGFMLYTARK